MMNLNRQLKAAITAAKAAGKIAMACRGKSRIARRKGKFDFALDADLKAEKAILQRLQRAFPDYNALTEETGLIDRGSAFTWIVDPLDGTVNYKHGFPLFAVAIALGFRDEVILGVIFDPLHQELYTTIAGKGAFMNGRRIRVSACRDARLSLVAGSPKDYIKSHLGPKRYRAPGSNVLELAYVARGIFDARIKTHTEDLWDFAAGSLLVEEAGGKVTDLHGKPWHIGSRNILASNGKVHGQLLRLMRP